MLSGETVISTIMRPYTFPIYSTTYPKHKRYRRCNSKHQTPLKKIILNVQRILQQLI